MPNYELKITKVLSALLVSAPIHKALGTHIWVATHGLRNADIYQRGVCAPPEGSGKILVGHGDLRLYIRGPRAEFFLKTFAAKMKKLETVSK